MQNKPVLVIGSKPGSKLPILEFKKIYTANGAAERAIYYKKKNKSTKLICLAGQKNFEKDFRVRKRILKSKPDRLIIRFGKVKIPKLLNKKCKIEFLSFNKQWKFQKKFFINKGLSMLAGELFYKEELTKKIKRFYKSFKNKDFQGISTGFYAILLALHENPNSKIIVSGIGMSGGGHFYKNIRSKKFNYDSRSAVDRYLVNKLNKKLNKKIFSLDRDFANITKTSLWSGKNV